jgi:signal transduction histidine kinase
MAAHLHDSVLQTLAMIQRAPTREDMSTLARAQERELRSWLYGRSGARGSSLREALDELASRVERLHRVRVDTVVVGDAPVDGRTRALVDATGEAVTNAAKHSNAPVVSVYAEADDEGVSVWVRDEGVGFDTRRPAPGRSGIVESIVGRMERNGGTATVSSVPSQGTEVHLVLPRRRP